jgi:hypothetical protein
MPANRGPVPVRAPLPKLDCFLAARPGVCEGSAAWPARAGKCDLDHNFSILDRCFDDLRRML